MTTVLARCQSLGARLFFDESVQWVEDWWQWIRLARHHRFLYEPEARWQGIGCIRKAPASPKDRASAGTDGRFANAT